MWLTIAFSKILMEWILRESQKTSEAVLNEKTFLASGDNFKHSHVKEHTGTNCSDVTFAEILLRGRVFKTSRNILTVLVRDSPTVMW